MHLTSTEEKIYIAGHRGMVGRALWQRLVQAGYENLVGCRSRELDLATQPPREISLSVSWHHSEQRARRFALGLLEAEQRMNRVAGHEDLPKLRDALQRELDINEESVREPLSEQKSQLRTGNSPLAKEGTSFFWKFPFESFN